jgi:hypothetical protein
MRNLNKEEQKIVQRVARRCKNAKCLAKKNLKVSYHTSDGGRLTIAEVSAGEKIRRFGVSSYNKADKKVGLPFDETIGQRIALARALRS